MGARRIAPTAECTMLHSGKSVFTWEKALLREPCWLSVCGKLLPVQAFALLSRVFDACIKNHLCCRQVTHRRCHYTKQTSVVSFSVRPLSNGWSLSNLHRVSNVGDMQYHSSVTLGRPDGRRLHAYLNSGI